MMAVKCGVIDGVIKSNEHFRGWAIIAASWSDGTVILLYIVLSFILLVLS